MEQVPVPGTATVHHEVREFAGREPDQHDS